jgi:hypothetical protein
MATWPTTLPGPVGAGYSIKAGDQALRTEMESGSTRTRRRTFARNDKVTVKWEMSDEQMAILRAWFEDSVNGAAGGAAWFTITIPIGTGGFVAVSALFIGGYDFVARGVNGWTVSAELELR